MVAVWRPIPASFEAKGTDFSGAFLSVGSLPNSNVWILLCVKHPQSLTARLEKNLLFFFSESSKNGWHTPWKSGMAFGSGCFAFHPRYPTFFRAFLDISELFSKEVNQIHVVQTWTFQRLHEARNFSTARDGGPKVFVGNLPASSMPSWSWEPSWKSQITYCWWFRNLAFTSWGW